MATTPNRRAGMSLHFAATAIFGFTGLILLAVASALPSPWLFTACGAATLGLACWAYGQTLRRDPWHAAIFALFFALFFGVLTWPVAFTVTTGWAVAVDVVATVLALVTVVAAGYIVWRKFGRERAPDFLQGCDVFEIDGVAMRWAPAFFGPPGGLILVEVELQNAYDAVLTVDVRLIPNLSARPYVAPSAASVQLQPGEYGVAKVAVNLRAHASGRLPLRVEVRTRRSRLLPRRMRLRPKQTLTVGAVELMSVLGAIAGEFNAYGTCCVEVVASPGASAAPEASPTVLWERRWIPEA